MLTKVTIRGFRSCVDVTLDDLGPTAVLVGRNGVGKTNILKAIQWAAASALRAEAIGPAVQQLEDDGCKVGLEFVTGGREYHYQIDARWLPPDPGGKNGTSPYTLGLIEELSQVDEAGHWWRLAHRVGRVVHLPDGSSYVIEPSAPLIGYSLTNLPPDHSLREHLHRIEFFLRRIRYYPFDEPSESPEASHFLDEQTYNEWLTQLGQPAGPGDLVLPKLLHLSLVATEKFEEIQSILGQDGLGLLEEIDIQAVAGRILGHKGGAPERIPEIYWIAFRMARRLVGARRSFTFADLSLGTRRIIRIIVAMIFDESSVMLIEHPEDGIHRALTRKVFSLLRTYTDPGQAIISSHSATVFDMMRDDPSGVRLVTEEDGATKVHALTAEEVGRARRYIDEEGAFSDFLESHYDL